MSTPSDTTPHSKDGSRRDVRSVISTPAARSSQQFVTPTSSKSSNKVRFTDSLEATHHPTRRSTRGAAASAPVKLKANPYVFSNRRSTCFSFGLDPSIEEHRKVICSKCKDVLSTAPNGIITDEFLNRKRTQRLNCERPWENGGHREASKRKAFEDFHDLFEDNESAVQEEQEVDDTTKADDTSTNPAKRRKKQPKTSNNQQHEAPHIRIFDEDGHFTNEAVKMFEVRLNASRKDDLKPNKNDMRVAGMMTKWIFDSQDTKQYKNTPVAVLPSFPRLKPMKVACIPQIDASVEETTRLRNLRLQAFDSWMNCLKFGNFNKDIMIDASMKNRETIPKHFLIRELNKSGRMSAESTLSAFEYAGINPEMGAKLAQAIDVETRTAENPRGLRLFAPTRELYKLKARHQELEYPSLKLKRVAFQELVLSNKKKGSMVSKTVKRWVGSCRGENAIYTRVTALRRSGTDSTAQIIVSKEDTKVHTCRRCSKSLLGVALRVHMYHAHDVTLCATAETV